MAEKSEPIPTPKGGKRRWQALNKAAVQKRWKIAREGASSSTSEEPIEKASTQPSEQEPSCSFHGEETVLAIAGEDFSIVASDTRLSEGFSIHSRDYPKTIQMTKNTVIGSCGFHGDVLTLSKVLGARLTMYQHEHEDKNIRSMSTPAIAAMVSTILYSRRFFPYYVYNIIGGLDEEGKGCVFSYDPVGSYEREAYRAAGSASAMLQPLLDNQIGFKNQHGVKRVPLTKIKAIDLIKDVFISAAERDIYTGDAVVLNIVTAKGVEVQKFPLRKD